MDMDVFKENFRKSLDRLPREILEVIPALVLKYLPILEKVGPAIVEDMQQDFAAIMIELPLNILDKEGLMNAVKDVLADFGIKDAAA